MKNGKNSWKHSLFSVAVLLIFASGCKKDAAPPALDTVTDIDGNVYHTVKIGTQVWMVENLRVTKYNDGTAIPLVTQNTPWTNHTTATAGYCWYDNDASTYKNTYGALYNWYTVKTGKLCPTGWHVPTSTEWTTLTTYLGGESVAGGKLKEAGTTHWINPNTGATNTSGFTALPGSTRNDHDGTFNCCIGDLGYWWASTEQSPGFAELRWMDVSSTTIETAGAFPENGLSVRCLKN